MKWKRLAIRTAAVAGGLWLAGYVAWTAACMSFVLAGADVPDRLLALAVIWGGEAMPGCILIGAVAYVALAVLMARKRR